jgi:hypothetical protein
VEAQHKNCLLIIPKSFYSFDKYLKTALNDFGYHVEVINDEYPEGTIGKIMGKLHIPLLLPITKRVIEKRYIKNKTFELVLIIKGRGVSIALLNKLKALSSKVVGYNFDSFSYNPAALKWYEHVDKYYTFDYRDADNHSLPVVELFTSVPKQASLKTRDLELSAILRNHSERLGYTDRVLNKIKPKKYFIYIYEKNIFTFLINFLNSPYLYIKYWKYIKFKPLAYNDYLDALARSDFTIDFAHPKQSGITIRCFEALSMQTKIITNNPYVNRNSHFNKENTIIYNSDKNYKDLQKQYIKIANKQIKEYRRTIGDFINDLIK